MESKKWKSARTCGVALLACALVGPAAWGLEPTGSESYLGAKKFFTPELYVGTHARPLEEVLDRLPNQAAWKDLLLAAKAAGPAGELKAFVDERSGAASNILGAFPLIPGNGVGNHVTLGELGSRLGRAVTVVDRDVVAAAVAHFVAANQGPLGIDVSQLGDARAEQATPELWQVSIPQTFAGIPVRDARLVASIAHGNLVSVGTETWGDVRGLSPVPAISADDALGSGFAYAGGRTDDDQVVRPAALEIRPLAVDGQSVGQGYGHVLTWTWAFVRPPEHAVWEVVVDAVTSDVLAFEDLNHYAAAQITGGVYPLTSTEICPNADTCGVMQSGWPMPFANTGLASPNNFTNSAGIFDYTSGTVTTTLSGRYVRISDTCGSISQSAAGSIDLGGVNGDHDCVSAGSAGNTASSRAAFYEINRIAEQARGWLPGNTWLQSQVTSNVNLNNTCNAFYSSLSGTVNFYRSGGGCRNTGELSGVFDHEWGHGLDDNDAGGSLSNTSEAYADIAMLYRLSTSCIGHGFWWTSNRGCGTTADGTGFNGNEAQVGAAHCDLDCSGVRDADWDKHADHTPDTALGFVCNSCSSSSGPCGRQVHCAAAPPRQAAWDLVTRDLPGAGFDNETSFIIGNKLFYHGSGNIGLWYNCSCGVSSDGCGAGNAYMQWLIADDDNGNLNDGTPHMAEIFAAFNRHGIACSSPTPQNGGCAGGPSTAATLTATPGGNLVDLSWTAVSGASEYWVFRTEGVAGCDFGKARIATVTGTSYTDTEVANGRDYHYNVVAAGTSSACFGPASTCQSATPNGAPPPPPPPPPPPTCAPKGAACAVDADCCSLKCKGPAGNMSCKG